jgi:hypothetical protein
MVRSANRKPKEGRDLKADKTTQTSFTQRHGNVVLALLHFGRATQALWPLEPQVLSS